MDTAASIESTNGSCSLEQIIAKYQQTVYGIALTHSRSRADADDVFQEVFAAYWRSKPVLANEEHRKAWLIRTTLNQCLKLSQSSWAQKTVLNETQAEEEPCVELELSNNRQEALYEALGSLRGPYRTVVQLFYFEDLSIAQIAEILNEEQGAIKTRLSRAREQLRSKLKAGKYDDQS